MVTGAGVGGLATAIWLADFGHEVVVLERSGQAGGRLRAGVPGSATLTVPAVLRDLFGKTGRRLDRELTLRPADPAVRYLTSHGPVVFPHASRGGTLAALRSAFDDGAAADWDRLMRRAGDIWAITRPVLVDRAAPSRRAVAALALRSDTRRAAFGTLSELLADLDITHPAVREILSAHAIAVGADPITGPALTATGPYLEQTFGVWTVDGGPSALAEALSRRATERGAVIHTGTAAERYEVRGRRAVAVHTTEGEHVPADVIVSAVAVAEHQRLLGRPSRVRRARSVLSIVWPGTQLRPGDDTARTVVTPSGTDPLCIVEYPAQGGLVIHVDVDRDEPIDDDLADEVVAGLARRGLDLGPAGATGTRRLHTPADWAAYLSLGAGSMHGPPANTRWATLRRPAGATGVSGLYRAGEAARPGPGIHAAAISAAIVADLVGRPA